MQASRPDAAPVAGPASGQRLLSLDAFRGLTVAAMVLVNNPGEPAAVWDALHHRAWNGWSLTETVAPAFLWIVGVGIAFSLSRAAASSRPASEVVGKAARRAGILFLLGMLLNAFPRAVPLFEGEAWRTLRVPGILQRIAICGFLATLMARRLSTRAIGAWIIGLLVVHTTILLAVPVPGRAEVVLEPRGNIAWWIDWTLLGSHSKASYAFDPLGVLGTVTSLATVLFGVVLGRRLVRGGPRAETAAAMATTALVWMAAGAVTAAVVPYNESLWTASFVLLMTGVSQGAFAVLFWVLDGLGRARKAAGALVAFGRNALLLFVVSQLTAAALAAKGFERGGRWLSLRGHVAEGFARLVGSPHLASALYAAAFVAIFFVIAVALDRRGFYWTV